MFNIEALLIGLGFVIFSSSALADTCPVPPVKVQPEVRESITFDQKHGLYTYSYTLVNEVTALLPIRYFSIFLDEAPVNITSAEKWHSSFESGLTGVPAHLYWSTGPSTIKPGESLSGFSFKSPKAPGLVKYFVGGKTGVPTSTPVGKDDEPTPKCPGFFFDRPRFDTRTNGMTQGPAPENQVTVSMKLKKVLEKGGGDEDLTETRPHKDTGRIAVIVKGKKEFDVKTIDVPSVRFGIGKAKALSSSLVAGNAQEDHADERGQKHLRLVFDLASVGVECDRDRALFLSGTTSAGKTILGAVPIKTKECP